MDKNILIVCRNLSDAGFISRIPPETGYGYFLASDDPRVHKVGKRLAWINETCWLEKMESFRSVANKTMEYIEAVNGWLKSLGNDKYGVSPDLLFWFRHVEGGMTTQRIQDALLLINAYLSLFDRNNIQSVVVIRCAGMLWEDEVLIETAKTRGIPVKIVGRFRFSVFVQRFRNLFKMMARQPYCICNLLWIKFSAGNNFYKENKPEKEIMFQLCGSQDKHVENIAPIMKAVADMGYNPVALCWKANSGAKKVRESGLAVDELERYVTFKDIGLSLYRSLQTLIRAIKLRPGFICNAGLHYQGVSLGGVLWPSILFYLTAELPQWCILNYAVPKYFTFHSPLAIKLWASGLWIECHLAMKYMNRGETPLLMYWFWHSMHYPYEPSYECIDLFLAAGKLQEIYLKEIGVTSDRIELTGMARYDFLADFKKTYRREDSLNHLKIPLYLSYYITYDPNAILRGFQSTPEQVQVTEALLNFAKNNPSVGLIIKPHPAHCAGILEDMVAEYSLKNVFVVDKDIQPYHALNTADMLITKNSTIGLEAMFFECPVISVILDGDDKFKVFGEAAEYIMNSKALNEFLNLLVKNADFRNTWKTRQIKRQKAFIRDFCFEGEFSSAILGAKAIDQHIKKVRGDI
ncbi:MAG: hypothetical protein Q7J65_09570 [Candidatus Marinimicrobia bacterium]|nr:hypothetical protein [Candidatus Neomarinimicrobiota bacterium]